MNTKADVVHGQETGEFAVASLHAGLPHGVPPTPTLARRSMKPSTEGLWFPSSPVPWPNNKHLFGGIGPMKKNMASRKIRTFCLISQNFRRRP